MQLLKIIIKDIYLIFNNYIFRYKLLKKKNVCIDKSNRFYLSPNSIEISNNVVIGAYNVFYAITSNHSKRHGYLYIGANTSIGEFNNIRAAGGEITIGENCLISQHVTMVASNHNIDKDEIIINQ